MVGACWVSQIDKVDKKQSSEERKQDTYRARRDCDKPVPQITASQVSSLRDSIVKKESGKKFVFRIEGGNL
jgi:hypothetical protein